MHRNEQDAFWIVWNPDGSRPPTHRHDTRKSAELEAERLARLNRGQTFIVLESVTARIVDDVKRIEYVHPIPF